MPHYEDEEEDSSALGTDEDPPMSGDPYDEDSGNERVYWEERKNWSEARGRRGGRTWREAVGRLGEMDGGGYGGGGGSGDWDGGAGRSRGLGQRPGTAPTRAHAASRAQPQSRPRQPAELEVITISSSSSSSSSSSDDPSTASPASASSSNPSQPSSPRSPQTSQQPLRARLRRFLPELRGANEALSSLPAEGREGGFEIVDGEEDGDDEDDGEDVDEESGEERERQGHIELTLGMGVLEAQACTDTPRNGADLGGAVNGARKRRRQYHDDHDEDDDDDSGNEGGRVRVRGNERDKVARKRRREDVHAAPVRSGGKASGGIIEID